MSFDRPKNVAATYARGGEHPLGGYVALLATYLSGVGVGLGLVARRDRRQRVADRPPLADLLLVAVATYRGARLVTKDAVTAVVRAPFTTFEEATGAGEVNEAVRGRGLRHAVGELLTCPFCFGMWLATALTFGLVLFPRLTRWLAGTLAAYSASDVLSVGWDKLKD